MTTAAALDALIAKLPKAELHIHIEGSLEPGLVFKLAERNQVDLPYESAEELIEQYDFSDLQSFLDIYYEATAVLIEEQDFFDLTWAYLERCRAECIAHTEIFFDPQSHTSRGISFGTVIKGIRRALAAAESQFGITSRLIMCYLRHLPASDALATWKLAEPYLDDIHGVGLDSSERGFPPSLFEDVFTLARAAGLKTVAHAGEEGPPAYIREALDLLHVARIDHGVRISEDAALTQAVAERRVPLTVCPLSNVRLRVFDRMRDHSVLKLLDAGLLVTINSDDPAYFGGYVNANYSALVSDLKATREQIIELTKNSFVASFLDQTTKSAWLREIDAIAAG